MSVRRASRPRHVRPAVLAASLAAAAAGMALAPIVSADGTALHAERFGEDLEAVLAGAGAPPQRSAIGIALSRMDLSAAVARIAVPTEPAGLTILKRTGHMAPLERPAEVSDALEGLLRPTGMIDA